MEHRPLSFFFGTLGFAFVVVWATLGATVAVLALLACVAAANVHRLGAAPRRKPIHERRRTVAARPLRDEDERHPLVPDDPSLIITSS
jgi:hypothetical protein